MRPTDTEAVKADYIDKAKGPWPTPGRSIVRQKRVSLAVGKKRA